MAVSVYIIAQDGFSGKWSVRLVTVLDYHA